MNVVKEFKSRSGDGKIFSFRVLFHYMQVLKVFTQGTCIAVSEIVGTDQYAAHQVQKLTLWNEKVLTITGHSGMVNRININNIIISRVNAFLGVYLEW